MANTQSRLIDDINRNIGRYIADMKSHPGYIHPKALEVLDAFTSIELIEELKKPDMKGLARLILDDANQTLFGEAESAAALRQLRR